MTNQLLPPPGMEPPPPTRLTPGQRMLFWADLMDAAEELLLARLRDQVGATGDVANAYRRWYEREMAEHDRAQRQMADNFLRCGVRHGR